MASIWEGSGGPLSSGRKKDAKRALAGAMQGEQFAREGFDEAQGYWRPQYDYGQEQLKAFQEWGKDPNDITSDPSYKWRLQQGQESLDNTAAAKGGALSGNALRAQTDYAQDAASQEYGAEFSRWMGKLGIGQNATGAMSEIAVDKGKTLGGMRAGMWQQNFNNRLAAAGEGRQAAGQLNSMIQSWFPSGGGSGGGGGGGDKKGGGK